MRNRLRVGIVGAGPVIERYHMPAINAVPEVLRTIVVDVNEERARHFANRYGFAKWSSDLSDLIHSADVAIIAVPNGQHSAVAGELLSQGVHVLCEKPMARNVDECLSMIESSRRSGTQLCIGHNRRFQQHIGLAKRLLHEGLIGQVMKVEAEEGSPNDWPRSPSYFDPMQSGGGALMDVGIHSIDLIRWIVAEFDEIEFTGNGTEKTVESEAELRFQLSTGATGRVITSRTRNLQQKLTLVGTEGFLEIGLWGPGLGIRSAKGKVFQNFERLDVAVSRRPPQDTSFVDQLRNFVSAVRGEEQLLVDGEAGMAAVDVVCRAYGNGGSASMSRVRVSGDGGRISC